MKPTSSTAGAPGGYVLPPTGVADAAASLRRWNEAEVAIGFGYSARTRYGDRYPVWSRELETRLESEWKHAVASWSEAVELVHHGYDLLRR